MLRLAGYQINTEISKSSNSTVFRGTREDDNLPVVVKLLNREYPSEKELFAYIREYEIMQKIGGGCIAKPYALEQFNNGLAIVMEDIGGESVSNIIKSRKLWMREKILLAIRMAQSLTQIHQQRIIHKDVNPTNFIWNTATGQVKIIDFSVSTQLTREASRYEGLNNLEGTISYISPEQTGRINRPIDYRTDLYSLGITYYEIFTGQLPFKGEDESEIVYSHIAKKPLPPNQINPEIPAAISDIILKLISKMPEERYQTALCLKKDLEFCLQCLESGKAIKGFKPGKEEIVDRFDIPHKLYGREEETAILIDGFEKAAAGHCVFLLVSGYSGVGKTSLINEIRKPVTGKKGYFASGKFSQLITNTPYSAFVHAFQELIRQLLSEPQSRLDEWKQRLLDELENNGQVIVDIIPELERIIGPQPKLIELNSTEAQNRFQMVFRKFITAIAGIDNPLVIFLDDMQWSDASTLNLLKYLLGPDKLQYVMLIGAYRDNEVQAGHPLMQMLDELGNSQNDLIYRQIILKPMEIDTINQMISETLHCSPSTSISLARLIWQKTKGNAFFVNQLLNSLYLDGAFTFIPEKGQWEYDQEKVEAAEISDNVVDLLVRGIQLLPADTIDALKLASCIGNQFDLATLLHITHKPVAELGEDLWVAIEKEFIVPLNSNYRFINTYKDMQITPDMEVRFAFAHDRIRQAVNSLLDEEQKSAMHLHIGRTYLELFDRQERPDLIFEIVNHLNASRGLILEKDKRIRLMNLNVEAGNRAKKSIAFSAAANYFAIAGSLLAEEEWLQRPDELFRILLEHAGAALLSGDLDAADALCDRMMHRAVGKFQISEVSNIRAQIFEFRGKLAEAIDEVRKSLRLFGVILPDTDDEIQQRINESMMRIQAFLKQTPVEELVNLPEMKDPEKKMVMQLLYQALPSAFHYNTFLFILMPLMMLELSITHGISPLTCKGLTDCAMDMATMFQDFETAYRLGKSAFLVIDRFKAESMKSAAYFSFTFCSYWRVHYRESLSSYEMSFRKGLETGDMQHASYAIAHKVHLMMWVGKNLTECSEETEKAIRFLSESQTAMPLLSTQIVQGAIRKLQIIPEDWMDFKKQERDMLIRLEKIGDMAFLARFYQYNTYVSFILGDMEEAEKWSTLADGCIFASMMDFPLPDHNLIKALLLISKWKRATEEEHVKMKEILDGICNRMKIWKESCPDNFAHKYYLLSANIAVIENQPLDVIVELFNKAMGSFGADDYIQYRALCNELYGEMWKERGDETIAKAYIREAYYLYRQWGACRKTEFLEKRYPHYFMPDDTYRDSEAANMPINHSSIDMAAILKSTQAISSEIKIEKLLSILLRTMIENAGAQRGCLLLRNEEDDQLYIEAMQGSSPDQFYVMQSISLTESDELCHEIVRYCVRTGETVVTHHALSDDLWQNNPYITKNKIISALCMPVVYRNHLKGVVYLENNLSDHVFTSERLKILQILSAQAAISIENARLYGNMEDIVKERTNQLNKANEILKELSYRDSLTNLYNRRYTFEIIANEVGKFIEHKKRAINHSEKRKLSYDENVIGIFLLDIDYFKEVNDTYGHLVGDKVLVQISKALKKMIRQDDSLVRWGGEEFLVILYNAKPEYLKKFARNVIDTIRHMPLKVSHDENIYKTCSVGFVEMPLDGSNPDFLNLEQMINLSDYALYCAKENGRNCAAQFELVKQTETDENVKQLLRNLSKRTRVNHEYFNIVLL